MTKTPHAQSPQSAQPPQSVESARPIEPIEPVASALTASAPAAPVLPGWRHVYSGKVRDLYVPDLEVPDADTSNTAAQSIPSTTRPSTTNPSSGHPLGDVVLVVASDRISAFDHVLTPGIPGKGIILTQLSLWWFDQLDVPNHVVSAQVSTQPGDGLIPAAVAGRALICRHLDMFPVECVARGYLTGSGLVEYRANGTVCGVPLPPGLQDGSKLPEPIFTPATKAALGDHDENVSFDVVAHTVGDKPARNLRDLTVDLYRQAAALAADRGIIVADTKFEFGTDPTTGQITLGDEVLTPDSSRFWAGDGWRPGGAQPSFDKQYVRDWLTSPASGWDRAGDASPPALPDDVVHRTQARYLEAYERLTGRTLAL